MSLIIRNLKTTKESELPKISDDGQLTNEVRRLVVAIRNNLHDGLDFFTQKYMGISIWGFLESNGYYSPRIQVFEAKQTEAKTTINISLRELHGSDILVKVIVPRSEEKELVLRVEVQNKTILEAKSLLDALVRTYWVSYAVDLLGVFEGIFDNPDVQSEGISSIRSDASFWSVLLYSDDTVVIRTKDSKREQSVELTIYNK